MILELVCICTGELILSVLGRGSKKLPVMNKVKTFF